MKLTLKEIAEIVSGTLIGNQELSVVSINTLSDAKENELSFLGNKKYEHFVKDTKAAAILFPKKLDHEKYKDKNLILVDDPQFACGKILMLIEKEKLSKIKKGISPKATIEENVILGKDVCIGHNVVIEDNTTIGDNTKILPNVFIGRDVYIGKNCLIYPNVTIRERTKIGDNCIINAGVVIAGDGFGFVYEGDKVYKKPQLGYVEIGNNVEIGANTTIDRATLPSSKTYIGDNTKIDNLVMIAHNVHIGKNSTIVAQVGIAGSTTVGNHVTLAGQVGLVGHINIGDNVMIGAQSGVTNDIEPNQIVAGEPLQPYRRYLQTKAIIKKLPEIYEQIKSLIKEKAQKDK